MTIVGRWNLPRPSRLLTFPGGSFSRTQCCRNWTQEALINNYDLQTAAARVEEARAQIGVARSFLYPQVNFNGGGSVQQVSRVSEPPPFGTSRTYQNWLLGLNMAWEFDVFGRIRREAESATGVFLATEQAQRGVYITLIADVAQSYFILRELDLDSLEIGRRTVKINDDTVEFYRRRLFGGVSNQLEVDQAVANRARTASTIPEVERQIVAQENLINFLLGRNPGLIPLGTALTDQYYPPSVPACNSRGIALMPARCQGRRGFAACDQCRYRRR